jgi:E3 ubiquitin-protein ligase ZNF598
MSVVATAPSHTPRGRARGRGGRGGNPNNRGRNAPRTNGKGPEIEVTPQMKVEPPAPTTRAPDEEATATTEDSGEEVCWICAEPVKYYSVSACNHRTCHVCALRLRALYKKMDCTFCKVSVRVLVQFWLE